MFAFLVLSFMAVSGSLVYRYEKNAAVTLPPERRLTMKLGDY